jgi:hypothetical protein
MKKLCVVAAALLIGACTATTDSDSGSVLQEEPAPSGDDKGDDLSQSDTSSSSSGDFDPGEEGGPLDGDSACAAQSVEATVVAKPVDIIIVIDNSGSMSGEIVEVQNQINVNFANIIEQSGIDYRVVMVSEHGSASGAQSVCVAAPLSGTTCSPLPSAPVNNAPTFFHHDAVINSHNALCQLIDQFSRADGYGLQPGGYQDVLRPEAFKTFLVVTDDRSGGSRGSCQANAYDDLNTVGGGEMAALQFDADLIGLSPQHFGTEQDRNYVFHSIVAMAAKDSADSSVSHLPSDPIITSECTGGAQNPGTGYQALSVLTGGLRHHSCDLDYTGVFQAMAQAVIEGASVPCELELPEAPDGQNVDLGTVVARYTPGGGGAAIDFAQVPSAAECAADSFYIDGDLIKLCAAACTTVEQDTDAAVEVLFSCMSEAK